MVYKMGYDPAWYTLHQRTDNNSHQADMKLLHQLSAQVISNSWLDLFILVTTQNDCHGFLITKSKHHLMTLLSLAN